MTTTDPPSTGDSAGGSIDMQKFPASITVPRVYSVTIENCVDISRIAVMVRHC